MSDKPVPEKPAESSPLETVAPEEATDKRAAAAPERDAEKVQAEAATTLKDDAEKPESGTTSGQEPEEEGGLGPDETPEPADVDFTQNSGQGQQPPQSAWNSFFNALAKVGPLAIIAILCLMVWPDYWKPGQNLFCPPEIQSVTAFLHCVDSSSWLAPMALQDGAFSRPDWPLFYMFTGLLAWIPGVLESNILFSLATAGSAVLALLGVWFFTFAAGFGSRAALASALILLCAPIFAPLHHFFGPVTLAAACMLFALGFFCLGWKAEHAWLSLPLAFIFTALAGLAGGPLYFIVPLGASICYLVWQARCRRGQRLDALAGFVLMLILVGLWIGALSMGDYPDSYLRDLFADSISFSWPTTSFWWLAIVAGFAGLVPWLLLVFGVSWIRVMSGSVKSLAASRKQNASTIMWSAPVLAICLTPFIPHSPVAAIGIAALVAPLLGKAFINLSAAGNRFFFLLACLLLFVVGLAITCAAFPASQKLLFGFLPLTPPEFAASALVSLVAVPVIGGICIAAALLGIFFVKRSRGAGGLLYGVIVTFAICQVALFMLMPKLAERSGLPLKKLPEIESMVMKAVNAATPPAVAPEPETPHTVTPAPVSPVAPAEIPAVRSEEPMSAPEATPVPEETAQPPVIQDEGHPVTLPDAIPVPDGEEKPAPDQGETASPESPAPDSAIQEEGKAVPMPDLVPAPAEETSPQGETQEPAHAEPAPPVSES